MKQTILTLFIFALMGCEKTSTKVEKEVFLEIDDTQSLRYFTADTIYTVNPTLVELLDPLFQHMRNDSFPASAREEEEWMREYCGSLCNYYDSCFSDNKEISAYAKVDSVMNEADRLYAQDPDQSTVGSLIHNDILHSFDFFRKYVLLSQLIDCCTKEDEKDLVYAEWGAYEKMEYAIFLIVTKLSAMSYWCGNYGGVEASFIRASILRVRLEMYTTLISIMKRDAQEENSTYPKPAIRQFENCIKLQLKKAEALISEDPELDSRIFDYKHKEQYIGVLEETKVSAQTIRLLISRWMEYLGKMDSGLTSSNTRHCMERAAALLLIKWAGIVCDME